MKTKWLITCFVAVFAGKSNAQLTFHSLKDVLNYADTQAFAIKNSQTREDLLDLKRKETKGNLLPTFNTYAGYNDNIVLQPSLIPAQIFDPTAPEGIFNEITFGTKYNYYIGGKVQWDVINFQKLFAVKTAEADQEIGKRNTALYKMNTYNTVANSYYSILLTKEAISIYAQNLAIADTIFQNAKNKYQQGIISEADLNLAEIRKLQTESTLRNTQNSLEQLHVQLQSQLNITDSIHIVDSLKNFLYDFATPVSVHPEVLMKEAEIAKQEKIIAYNKALRYPSLSLNFQATRTWANEEFFKFSDAYELPNQVFGATLSLPLINLTTRGKVKQSKLELSIKESELENIRLVKQKEDEMLSLQYKQATELTGKQEKILQLQQTNDVHAANKYQKDIISLDDRLKHFEDLLISQDSYLQSLGTLTIIQYQLYIRNLNYE
jgi:outer membrane protein TolC